MERERLAAFVDGELSPEEAAAVVMHLADHPEDQAHVDDLMAATEVLALAFAAPLHEPVPEAIRRAVLGPPADTDAAAARVVPFRQGGPFRRGPLRNRAALAWVAAAGLAAAVAAVAVLPSRGPGTLLAVGPADSALGAALSGLASGRPQPVGRASELMILATLPVPGGFCREVEVIDRGAGRLDLALACRRDGAGWTVEAVLSEPLGATGTADGFVPAGGAEVQGLQPLLDRLGAGPSLPPAAEAEAMARGWTP